MDYYQILGVKQDATKQEIKDAYRIQALIFHPDKHTNASNTIKEYVNTKFKLISNAYEILSNDSSRASHDSHFCRNQIQHCQCKWCKPKASSSNTANKSTGTKSRSGFGSANSSSTNQGSTGGKGGTNAKQGGAGRGTGGGTSKGGGSGKASSKTWTWYTPSNGYSSYKERIKNWYAGTATARSRFYKVGQRGAITLLVLDVIGQIFFIIKNDSKKINNKEPKKESNAQRKAADQQKQTSNQKDSKNESNAQKKAADKQKTN